MFIEGIVKKNVLVIQASASGAALLPVTGVCPAEAECPLCFRKIPASSGEPERSLLAPRECEPRQ